MSNKFKLSVGLVLGTLVTAACGVKYIKATNPALLIGSTYYVATNGDDTADGSSSKPWLTMQHAVDTIQPGDVILVRSGTYAGVQISSSGTAAAPKTLKADSGAHPVITTPSSKTKQQSLIEIQSFSQRVAFWVIDGFETSHAPHYGIDIRAASYITVQNCITHDSGNQPAPAPHYSRATGIFMGFVDHAVIQFNESYANSEHGIYASNSADYPTVRGNKIHDNLDCGIHMNGDGSQSDPFGGDSDGIISYALIEGNVIYNNSAGGGSAIDLDGVSDSIIHNNVLYNNHGSGISLFQVDGAESSSRDVVHNNTIIMPAVSRWVINQPEGWTTGITGSGNIIENNVLYHPTRGSIFTVSSKVPGFVSDYNIVGVPTMEDDGGVNGPISLAQWQKDTGQDTHSFASTPDVLFVGPTDFHLKPGSPAVDTGTSTPMPPATDFDGVLRPQGPRYDIGAYELVQVMFKDMSVPHDLLPRANDMTILRDMAIAKDMAKPRDMAKPQDMTILHDLSRPQDLSHPLDMTPAPVQCKTVDINALNAWLKANCK